MSHKTRLEITIDEKTNVYKVKSFLQNVSGVKSVGVVKMDTVRVTFHPEKIKDTQILKLIGSVDKDKRKRRNNIVSIKPYNDAA